MNRFVASRVFSYLAFLLIGIVPAGTIRAGSLNKAEEEVLEAAFLYQFTKFVDWPGDKNLSRGVPIRIGIAGDDRFARLVESVVEGKRTAGRAFEVRRIREAKEIGDCHVLFLCEEAEKDILESDVAESQRGVLTVGETDRFMQSGGIIRFFVEERKLRFEVNPAAAARAGLRISSQMLKLARIVEDSSSRLEWGEEGACFALASPDRAVGQW